jgi:hypothetical protein
MGGGTTPFARSNIDVLYFLTVPKRAKLFRVTM